MTVAISESHLAHLYRITDAVTGRFYIGKHGGKTQGNYWGSGLLMKNYIKKHGRSNLKYEILVVSTPNYIYDLEKKLVTDDFLKANPNCMNLAKGGMGGNLGCVPYNKGKKMSLDARQRLSIAKMGKPSPRRGAVLSDETKLKISMANKGKVNSKATLEKIKLANTNRKHQRVECPHCNTIGGVTGMARWHFDNCKQRGILWQV
jgi:hypothetical protein